MKYFKQLFLLSGKDCVLWGFSLLCTIGSFFLFHSEDVLTLIASVIGVTALIYLAKGYAVGQLLTVVFAVFYGIISFYFRYYGEMITYLCMTAPTAVLAFLAWIRNPYAGSAQVSVQKLSKKQLLGVMLLTVLVTAVFYFILRAMGNANLPVSTVSVATSFLASCLSAVRSPYYALAYAANDIVLIVLWTLASFAEHSYIPMVVCFTMFFLNDLYAFFCWTRMEKAQSAHAGTAA